MAKTAQPGPAYDRPPVIETVVGVQFERLSKARNAHWGAFWKTLDDGEWPTVSDAPLLEAQFEQFEPKSGWGRAIQLQLTQDPTCRIQIKNGDANRMLQIQNGRIHLNWLGKDGGEYPRYEAVRSEFSDLLRRFQEFLAEEELGEFKPNQWEATYVNHIPRGTVWNTPSDWGFFRLLDGMPTLTNVIEGESFAGQWHFVIPPRRGRLHIDWQHGRGTGDGEPGNEKDFVRLTLTARGPMSAGGGVDQVLEGIDLGRATIVQSFRDLMSEDANRFWGLRDEDIS
jgi:uncharacterized protein (TIGR04255 family)